MFDVVGLLMWLVGMRLAHFSLHCKDPGFSREQRCEVVLFSLLLQSCFELNSQSLDLITQQALGSVLALANDSGPEGSGPGWSSGTVVLSLFVLKQERRQGR